MRSFLLIILFCIFALPVQAALVVDTGDSPAVNNLGGRRQLFNDGYSQATFTAQIRPGADGSGFARSWSCKIIAGAEIPYAGFSLQLNADGAPMDLSEYFGVRFRARGRGFCDMSLPITATNVAYNHFLRIVSFSDDWTLYEIPFSTLRQGWGIPAAWDPASVTHVQWAVGGEPGIEVNMQFDDVEFYTQTEALTDEGQVYFDLRPKVDQVGYLSAAEKYFSVVTQTARVADAFWVVDAEGNTVYAGSCGNVEFDDQAASGETLVQGDFSTLQKPGSYRIRCGGQESYPFVISDNVYHTLFRDAQRAFYIIRANNALNDPLTGIRHPASHQQDASLELQPGVFRDLRGGWYNAGDYGKWVPNMSMSASCMLWLYQLKTNAMKNLTLQIPESDNGISDLLDEARVGIEWILKMQNPDGSVYHKVDTEPDFAVGLGPDEDPNIRKAGCGNAFSSVDAAHLVAVAARASRIYDEFDNEFSRRCRVAAQLSFAWLQQNPDIGQTDIYYTDNDPSNEVFMARCEMRELLDDASLDADISTYMSSHTLIQPGWQNSAFFGYLAYCFGTNRKSDIRDQMIQDLVQRCEYWKTLAYGSAYGMSMLDSEYYWGSNQATAARGVVAACTAMLTGDKSYNALALRQLHYLLGLNALNFSHVTAQGTRRSESPYHWTCMAYGNPLPGWLSGGANGSENLNDSLLQARVNIGTPPAKCHVDACSRTGSWASNEGTTESNASLVFLSGMFYHPQIENKGTPDTKK